MVPGEAGVISGRQHLLNHARDVRCASSLVILVMFGQMTFSLAFFGLLEDTPSALSCRAKIVIDTIC